MSPRNARGLMPVKINGRFASTIVSSVLVYSVRPESPAPVAKRQSASDSHSGRDDKLS